jgi:hypothetical protein
MTRGASAGGREREAPVGRHVAADLEHDLIAIVEDDALRVDLDVPPVDEDGDGTGEAGEPRGRERLAPDREDRGQLLPGAIEAHDAGRIDGPDARATARLDDVAEADRGAADSDPRGDDHDSLACEQLEVDTAALSQPRVAARERRCGRPVRRRVVERPDTDRRRHRSREQSNGEGQHRPHRRHGTRLLAGALGLAAVLAAAGCGGGSSDNLTVTVGAARTYHLAGFRPAAPVRPGVPTTVAFTVIQPDGSPLTKYKHGAGPHNGVHLILVRRDLATIIHVHPPIAPNGRVTTHITFPSPGPYKVVIDVYPQPLGPASQTNFQLPASISVAGKYAPRPLPPFSKTVTVDGYRFVLHGTPHLKAIDPVLLDFTVTTPSGTPARFMPWFGALAHAIFFRKGSLDYFHTHVCAAGVSGCTSIFGAAKVTGSSTTPGHLKVGVLVPVPGTWRLFLQTQIDGKILTAPFTLHVS